MDCNVFLLQDWIAERLDPDLARKFIGHVPRISRESRSHAQTSPGGKYQPIPPPNPGGGDPGSQFINIRPNKIPEDSSKFIQLDSKQLGLEEITILAFLMGHKTNKIPEDSSKF